MEPSDPKQSQFYSDKPIFGQVPTPQRRSRMEGNGGLLTVTIVVIALAAVSAFFYFSRQEQVLTTPVIQPVSTPAQSR
jgi:hypothetical protein